MATASTTQFSAAEAAEQYRIDFLGILSKIRHIDEQTLNINGSKQDSLSIEGVITHYADAFRRLGTQHELDADALDRLRDKIMQKVSFGGLGFVDGSTPSDAEYSELLFQTEAYLESVNSQLRSRSFLKVTKGVDNATRPMTLAQKIFTQHALAGVPEGTNSLAEGDVIRAGVDWVIASELSWSGMAQTYEELGSPGIWRNDRFWIAGDHVVHPSIVDQPKIKAFIESSEKAKKDFKMTEYQGMNYTIMHTEFTRERAEPGMLVVGSDSHTCSAGAVGCLSIGLGAADVMMTLALGETWFKVPESLLIELKGRPSFAISGKDIILHILKELKRNTVAAERIVEFVGEGVQYLSVDARFAICNMCTEFGAITGVFVPDAITQDYIDKRKRKANKSSSLYFCPDPEAMYAERFTIDLSAVESCVAVYPNPDDVVPVSQKAGMRLDGVFLGACTTTEEELVLAGLLLKAGIKKGLPMVKGKRHYVPGSLPIVEKLKQLELLEVYEAAGFTRGPPGCSMCVGLIAEKASEGETWLSSQNRNFKNRMGPGAIGHLSSAAVCAASAFSMTVTDPVDLLNEMDVEFFNRYRDINNGPLRDLDYAEPIPNNETDRTTPFLSDVEGDSQNDATIIQSKIVVLGDFVDTDALSPGFTLTSCKTEQDFGQHVLCFTNPDFRDKVKAGQRVVVGGKAFGVGSSRESAVSALKGAGVQAVIARSFAFIFGRNQPSLGLLGIVMDDEEFYAAAEEGHYISIDLPGRTITVAERDFPFKLSEMEYQLTQNKGIALSYQKYGKSIWEKLTMGSSSAEKKVSKNAEPSRIDDRLKW